MAFTLGANIEAEIARAELAVIDLVIADFGDDYRKYWSTHEVSQSWYPTEDFGLSAAPSEFEPRLSPDSITGRTWKLGIEDDSMTLVLSDADGEMSAICREIGIQRFQTAKVTCWRLFPSVKECYKMWFGWGRSVRWVGPNVEWEVIFGFAGLRRRFGRRINYTCPHIFGGPECPYDPANGIGLPSPLAQPKFTAAASTSNTVIYGSGTNFTSTLAAGYIIWNKTKNCYATVSAVVSDTQVSITSVVAGEGGTATFASGDECMGGLAATSCGKDVASCKARGMFGPHTAMTSGPGDRRRYYGGNPPTGLVTFYGRASESEGRGRFSRLAKTNKSLDGEILPVAYGLTRLYDIEVLHWLPAGDFQHGYFHVCEGQIVSLMPVLLNGQAVDDGNVSSASGTDAILQHDPFIVWGTYQAEESSRITDLASLRAVRRAVGVRKCYCRLSGTTQDTYGTGTNGGSGSIGNPYGFNTAKGEGVSPSGKVSCRWRIQVEADTDERLTAIFDVHGLLVEIPTGHSLKASLGIKKDTITVPSSTDYYYSKFPNPVLVARDILTSHRYGAGIAEDYIDDDSIIAASEYCEGQVVDMLGEGDATGVVTAPVNSAVKQYIGEYDSKKWVWTQSPDLWKYGSNELVGRVIDFDWNDTDGKPFSAIIRENALFKRASDTILRRYIPGNAYFSDETMSGQDDDGNYIPYTGQTGQLIFFDPPVPDDKAVASGRVFKVRPMMGNVRYKANGALTNDDTVGDVIKKVLLNCNGDIRQSADGQIEILIRRKLTSAEIANIVSNYVFTDRGTLRNIIANDDGMSTLDIWQESIEEVPNSYKATFYNSAKDYVETDIEIYSEEAQTAISTLHGDSGGREKNEENVELGLTTGLGQAARLLALIAREKYIQNLYCSFSTSLKVAEKVQPGDIVIIDSNRFAMLDFNHIDEDSKAWKGALFFRVLEKSETSRYTYSFKCQVHINSIYDDKVKSFGQFFYAPEDGGYGRNTPPMDVIPSKPTATTVVNPDGSIVDYVDVEITWPDN